LGPGATTSRARGHILPVPGHSKRTCAGSARNTCPRCTDELRAARLHVVPAVLQNHVTDGGVVVPCRDSQQRVARANLIGIKAQLTIGHTHRAQRRLKDHRESSRLAWRSPRQGKRAQSQCREFRALSGARWPAVAVMRAQTHPPQQTCRPRVSLVALERQLMVAGGRYRVPRVGSGHRRAACNLAARVACCVPSDGVCGACSARLLLARR
jgi:hypothetical protein